MKMPVDPVADAATAAVPLPRIVVTGDGRRMRLADEETLRYFLSRPLRPPLTRSYSPELMRGLGLDDGEVHPLLRAFHNEQSRWRVHKDVLEQYNARGYAYIQIPEECPDDEQAMEQLN